MSVQLNCASDLTLRQTQFQESMIQIQTSIYNPQHFSNRTLQNILKSFNCPRPRGACIPSLTYLSLICVCFTDLILILISACVNNDILIRAFIKNGHCDPCVALVTRETLQPPGARPPTRGTRPPTFGPEHGRVSSPLPSFHLQLSKN